MARKVLKADVSGGVRGRPRLGWMRERYEGVESPGAYVDD